MKICYLISRDYYNLTLKSIESIVKFYKGQNEIEFVLFHFGDLEEIVSPHTIIKIEKRDYPFFIHRGLIFDSLDEKIIFIDSDTICLTDISKLYNIDLEGNMLGVVIHNWIKTHKEAYTVYKPTEQLHEFITLDDFPFFNAGVMLVDCKKWKQVGATGQVFQVFETYKGESYDWNDEVALNCLFGRMNCKFIDNRWNYNERDFIRPFIKHYYGHNKNL